MARKLTAVLAVLLLAALAGFAGEGKGKMDAASHAAKLKAELNLNADQTTKVETIFADFLKKLEPIQTKAHVAREQLNTLRSANPPDAAAIKAKESDLQALKAQKHALIAERDETLKKVLTPEQFVKFQEMTSAHGKQHMKGEHPK